MNGGNPYGAVPEALKETRLTLRDLMAAHMENKVMEGRLGLEKAKAETELAMVGANIKRDEIRSLHDTAQLNQSANQFTEGQAQQANQFNLGQEQTTTLHREDARQRAGEFTVTKGQRERELDQSATAEANRNAISLKELAIRQREEGRKNEVKTAAQWAQAAGISPDLLGFLGVDGQQKLKRQDAEQLHGTVQAMFKSNPALGFMANGYALRGDLTRMQEQLKDPSLLPAQATTLQKQYEAKLGQFEILDKLIMAEKAPDQAKIVETARRLWSEDPTQATKYKNFDEFSQEIQKNVSNARGLFGEDVNNLKISDAKNKVTAKYDQELSAASAIVRANAKPDQVAAIKAGRVEREARGDYKGAYEYTTGWAKNLSGGVKTASPTPVVRAAGGAAPAEAPSALKNIAAARRAEAAARRIEDAKIAAARRIQDAETLKERARNFREANKGIF